MSKRLSTVPPDPGPVPTFPTDPLELEPGCARCPALVDSRERVSWGNGPRDASIVVVGEAPGAGDPAADRWRGGNWTGMAYTSRHSGQRIRALIDQLGYADEAFFTNAVKCFPESESDGRSTNREPTTTERTACRDHLLAELELVDPDVIVTTGKHATASLFEADGRALDGFLEVVLEPSECREVDGWLLPILHPSYQDVWIARLGYEPAEYVEAIEAAIEDGLGA